MSVNRPVSALASTRRRKGVQLSLATAVAAVLASQSASASSLTWKDSDSNNIWDLTATTNWVEGTAWNNSTPDSATFGGTGETVTLGLPIIASGLTFNSTGYTIDNGGTAANTLTLGGATPTITVTNLADSATISAVIAGTAGFTKAGAGTLTLSGLNSFTGVLTVTNGTLKVGAAAGATTGVLGAGGVGNETVVQSGATLDINGKDLTAEIVKIAGTGVGGNGAIVSSTASSTNGLNKLVLTGDASIGGANRFDLRGGTAPTLDLAGFTLTKVGAAQFSVVDGTVTSGDIAINAGTLSLEATTTATGAGTITIGSGGTLGLYGNTGSITRAITSNGGTISNLGSTATIGSPITLSTGTTTTLAAGTGAFGTNLTGVISGSGSLSKTGTGALTLSGANTFTGNLTIAGGILGINSDSALGAVPAAFTATNITLSGGTLANFSQATTAINFSSGFDVNLNANRGITLAANSTIQVGYNKTMTINGQIAGAFTLTKSDNGTLVLNGDNSGFVGAGINTDSLILTGGTLALGSDTAAGTGRINLNVAGGTIRSADANARTIANAINLSNNIVFGSASTGSLTFTGAVAGGANSKGFTINNATTEFSGVISGTGTTTTFTKDGPGTLIFSGANTFTQSTTVNAGTLVLEYANQNNSKIAATKALNLGSGKLTINSNGAADTTQTVLSTALTAGAATITVNKNAASNNATLNLNAISRAAASTLNVIYGGTGTGIAVATTDTTNTNGILGGWATVNGADWAVNSTNAADGAIAGLASGSYTPLVAAATSDTANGSVSGSLTLSGAHTHNSLKVTSTAASQSLALGANLLTLNGGTSGGLLITGSNAYTISGTTGNKLTAGDSTTAGAYDLIVQQFNTGGANISAVIGDNGTHAVNLIKAGTGTLTLSGVNTFTGKTYVNSGTLSISNDNQLGATPAAVVSDQLTLNGGTLQATSTNFTLNTNRGITLGTAGGTVNLATTSGNSVTYGGVISGGGSLTITGTSATNGLKLSVANSYTGGTIINSGRIELSAAAATLGAGSITIDGTASTGGSLFLTAGVTLSNPIFIKGPGGESRGTVRMTAAGSTLSGPIVLLANSTLSSDGAVANTISGSISGAYTLTLNGTTSSTTASKLTLSGNNSQAATTLGTGIVNINADAALGTPAGTLTINNNATLQAGAAGIVLNAARPVSLASGTGTIDTNGNTMTVASVIGGAGGLTKAGTGTLILSGANTYAGATAINAGTLQYVSSSAIAGTGANITANAGGAVAFDYADVQSMINSRLVKSSAGAVALTAKNAGESIDFSAAGANLPNAFLGASGNITYTGTFTPNNSATYRLGSSGGVLTFAAPNQLTSATDIFIGGSVTLGTGVSVPTGTNLTFSGTGTFDLGTTTLLPLGTVTLNGAITGTLANNTIRTSTLTFTGATTVATLAGGTIDLNGRLSINANTGAAANNSKTISSNLTGTGDITIAASGDATTAAGGGNSLLTLSGTNTFIGNVKITSGVVSASSNFGDAGNQITLEGGGLVATTSTTFARQINLAAGATGTLRAYSSQIFTVNGPLTGSGNLRITDSGTVVLAGNNTYTGTTTIAAGTLRLGNNATNALSAADITFEGTATLANGTVAGASAKTLANNITINSGIASFDGGFGDLTLGGVISGAGAFTKASSGTVTVTGANTYAGTTTLSGGTLAIGSDTALGTGQLDFRSAGATITIRAADATGRTIANTLNLATDTVFGSSDTGNLKFTGTLAAGSGAKTFTVNNSKTEFSGIISGTGGTNALTKNGPGTLIFSGANTYTHTTTVNAGTLSGTLTSGTPFGIGNVVLNAGTLSLDPTGSGADVAVTGANTAAGSTFAYAGGGTLSLNKGTNTSLTYTVGNAAPSGAVLVRGNRGTLVINQSAAGTLGSTEKFVVNGLSSMANKTGIFDASVVAQSGSGNTGAGTFVKYDSTAANGFIPAESGTSSYTAHGADFTTALNEIADVTAAATITNGAAGANAYALRVGAVTATLSGTMTINGAAAGVSNSGLAGVILNPSATASKITGGTLDFGSSEGVIYVGSGSGGSEISSLITGTAGLTKFGPGTLVLPANNTYTGATSVQAGTLQIGGSGTLGAGGNYAGAITTNGTLQYSSSADQTFSGGISGLGGLIKDTATSTLTLTGANTYSGGTVISAGTLYLNYATAAAPAWANITGAGTLRLNSAQAVNGSANWTPSTAISLPTGFTGTLQLDKGRINGTPANLGGTTNLLIGDGAQFLAFDGTTGNSYTYPQNISISGMGWGESGQQLGALRISQMNATFSGGITLTAASGLYTQSNPGSSMNVTGIISDGGSGFALTTNAGSGPITFSNSGNNYAGNTIVNTGTLKLGASNVIPDGPGKGNVTVNSTFDLNTFSEKINGLSGTGTVDNVAGGGSPTLTVGGNDATASFGGVIKNTSGTLAFAKAGAGIQTLTAASTYVGPTIVGEGTLAITGSIAGSTEVDVKNNAKLILGGTSLDRIGNLALFSLGGGTASGPATVQLDNSVGQISESVGALSLASTAVLDLGTGSAGSAFHFADSSAQAWTGTLNIYNWSSDSDHLFFGNSFAGLTSTQLSSIIFYSDAGATSLGAATFVGGGEIAPVPEPSALVMGVGMLGFLFSRRRRSSR